jgi:hypothetical protein
MIAAKAHHSSRPAHTCAAHRLALACLALAAVAQITGCGPRNYENENDRLRAQVMDLSEQVTTLQAQAAGLQKQLEVERATNPAPLPEGVNPPLAVDLTIHGWTSAFDADRDGKPDSLRIYLQPKDAQQRVVQVVGSLRIDLVALPVGSDPVNLKTVNVSPQDLNAAYRSAITGPHYTLTTPIDQPLPENTNALLIRTTLTDALTGKTLTAERTIAWK